MIAHVVLIHDQPSLRRLLADLLRGWTKHQVEVEEAGYDVRLPGVWQRWIEEADLFILGLERCYDLGMRAEGVTVAGQLIRSSKRVLIVGSDAMSLTVDSRVYWDIGAKETFLQAVDRSLFASRPTGEEIASLTAFFENRLTIPTGH